jgi:hypothetical protein
MMLMTILRRLRRLGGCENDTNRLDSAMADAMTDGARHEENPGRLTYAQFETECGLVEPPAGLGDSE